MKIKVILLLLLFAFECTMSPDRTYSEEYNDDTIIIKVQIIEEEIAEDPIECLDELEKEETYIVELSADTPIAILDTSRNRKNDEKLSKKESIEKEQKIYEERQENVIVQIERLEKQQEVLDSLLKMKKDSQK